MSPKKTTKTTKTKTAKSTRKATKKAIESIQANLDAIDGAEEKKGKAKKAKPAGEAKAKKLSAIDAAAQVLAETKQPMNTREMIKAMEEKNLWTSPGGKTPHATLYSAILREINVKGNESRFTKTERGKFTANSAA